MTMHDKLLPEYDLDYSKGRPNRYAGQIDWSHGVILVDDETTVDHSRSQCYNRV